MVGVSTLRDTHAIIMKLILAVDKPRNGDFFTPTEEVHGRVELKLGKNEKIPSIHIDFRGKRDTLVCTHACQASG